MIPNKKIPWLPSAASHLYLIEQSFGIAQKDILPSEEKFVLLEGTVCFLILRRPGMWSVYFEAPVPQRNFELGDVGQLTFGQAFV